MKKTYDNLPERFLRKLPDIIPQDKMKQVLGSFSVRKPICFRINTLKSDADTVLSELDENGIKTVNAGWYKDAFVLEETASLRLQLLNAYAESAIYIQNLSSMLVPLVLEPSSDEKILDMTAAPGSKTAQIAALMDNRGEIVANDANRKRFFKLKANLEQLGVKNTRIMNKRGEFLFKEFQGYFDKVLLDAPCSSEGRFNLNDSKTLKYWTPFKSKEMVRKQKPLLASAVSCLKPGGILVYSTCTFNPAENEMVIDWALRKFKQQIVLEKVEIPVSNHIRGLTQWNKKQLNPQLSNTVRVLPDDVMDAFYIAKIRKTREI